MEETEVRYVRERGRERQREGRDWSKICQREREREERDKENEETVERYVRERERG
jgi:hypothetical protein